VRSAYTRLRDATFKIAVKRFPFSAVLNRSLVKGTGSSIRLEVALENDSVPLGNGGVEPHFKNW
jgi:hypothetical protein